MFGASSKPASVMEFGFKPTSEIKVNFNAARDDGVVVASADSWAICKSFAPLCRQITTPAPHHSINLYMLNAVPDAQPTVSEH